MQTPSTRALFRMACLFLVAPFPVSAATEGPFTYVVNANTVTITRTDLQVAGAVVIPPTIEGKPVTVIGNYAFAGSQMMTAISIPSSVTSIEQGAFSGSGLTSIVLPASVDSVGEGAFRGCQGLTRVVIEAGLERLENFTFNSCLRLEEIRLPPGLRSIGESSLGNCIKLSRVSIPASVTSIENRAFELCLSLAGVVIEGDAPILGRGVFALCGPGFKLFASPKAKGFTFPLWNNFRVTGPSEEIAILPSKQGTLLTSSKVGLGFSLLGAKTEGLTLTIHNVGTRPLRNLSASLNGGNAGDFILKTSLRKALAPGESAELKVSFKPLAIRNRSTTLIVKSSDRDEPEYRITLRGSGVIAID